MTRRRRSVLQSKVARRILMLFVLCALIPVGTVAVVVLTRSSARMRKDGMRQLQRACKARAMAVYERLQLLDAEMRMSIAGGQLSFDGVPGGRSHPRPLPLARISATEPTDPMFGSSGIPPSLSEEQWAHLGRGKPLIVKAPARSQRFSTFLVRALDAERARDATLWIAVTGEDLIDFDTMISTRRLSILDGYGTPIETARSAPSLIRQAAAAPADSSRGTFEWTDGGEPSVGCYWSLFLKG